MSVVSAGKFGTPFHGEISNDGSGLVIHLPNGATLDYPYSISSTRTPIKLSATDAPAPPETTSAEATAGKEWRNYLLYQYGTTDPYHSNKNGSLYGSGLYHVATWFYTPTFGITFEILVVGPDPNGSSGGDYSIYALDQITGDVVLVDTVNYTNRQITIADIVDGQGDKALFTMPPVGSAGAADACVEWVLSYADGVILLADTFLLDSVSADNTSSSSVSYIARKQGEIQSTITSTPTCGGLPRELRDYSAAVITVDGSDPNPHEYYETWSSFTSSWIKRKYENESGSTFSRSLVAALYIDGVASLVTLATTRAYTKVWSFALTYAYEAHEELNPDCSSTLIIGTPQSFSDVMTYAYTISATITLEINGVSAVTRTSTGTVDGEHTTTGTSPTNLWHSRWSYSGTTLLPHSGGTYDSDSSITSGQWAASGSTIGTNTLTPSTERVLHPVIYELWSGTAIHPGGNEAVSYNPSTQEINYNPATQTIQVTTGNFSWV